MARSKKARVKTDVTLADVARAIESMGATFNDRIDALSSKLNDRIDALGSKLNDRIDALGARLDHRIDGLAKEVRALRKDAQVDRRMLRKHELRISKLENRVARHR